MIWEYFISPFAEFAFMRRALVGCLALALGGGPIGVFLVARRMTLMGDALSHAILPGVAAGFLIAGLSMPAMSLGGFAAGLAVALAAGAIARFTPLREDASFAAACLMALAAGVLMVSLRGGPVDLFHVLFGSVLAVDDSALILIAGIATATLLTLALFYRGIVAECFDPGFLMALRARGAVYYFVLLGLAVVNLVAGFQALGSLMALGLMLLPAVASGFWASQVWSQAAVGAGLAALASVAGLLLSFHADLPSGPSIVLVAGVLHLVSVLIGTHGSLRARYFPAAHLQA